MLHIRIRWYSIILAVLLLLVTWFSFERIVSFVEINSPLPKRWVAVTLSTGDTLYGYPSGFSDRAFRLTNAYALEKFVAGGVSNDPKNSVQYSISRRSDEIFLNPASVVSWEFIPAGAKVLEYLK